MIYFINGRSGSGKSTRLLDIICDKAQGCEYSDDKKIILIVPEQCSFQNECELLNRLGPKKAQGIEVLSLRRLCDLAEREYGKDSRKELTDGARLVMMSLAIDNVKDNLKLYGGRAGKPDLTSLMMTVISEYKTCSISSENVMEMSKKTVDSRLRKKLYDSALIYEAYDAIMANTYCDPLDRLSIAYDVLYEHKFFAGKTVAIDSFHSFTAEEMKIISLCATQSEDLYITLCRDTDTNYEESIFCFVNRTYSALRRIAHDNNIEYKNINLPDGNRTRFNSSELRNIEELIFRSEGLECDSKGAVSLYEAEDIYDESEQTARDIRKLISEGYRYNEIAIICRNSDMYRGIINSAFSKYDIPLFVSYPEKLESKPLMRFVLSALETVVGAFTTDAILTMLKTGMTSVDYNDICKLENYIFLWNIKGSEWQKPFTKSINGFIDRNNDSDKEELNRLEENRAYISKNLISLREKLKSGDGASMVRAVYELLKDFDVFNQVKKLSCYLEENGETILAEEELRIWDMMIEILDALYETLDGKYITSQKFFDLIKLIVSQGEISTIPRTMDEVTIGNADTVRPQSPRAVFIIGAIDGIFPQAPTESGIFTNSERDELIAMSLPLTDSINALYLQEEFFAYKSCTAASEKLFISRYIEEQSGEAINESQIFTEIKAIFPSIKVRTRKDIPLSDIICSCSSAIEQYSLLKRSNPAASQAIGECLLNYPECSEKIKSAERVYYKKPFEFDNSENSKKLFGKDMNISATQIEEYHKCAFRYFCRYGIKAQPNERAKFDPRQYGSTVHFIFEKLLSSEYGIEKLAQMDKKGKINAVENVLDEYLVLIGGEEEKTASFMKLYRGVISSVMIILDRMIRELTLSSFKPVCAELPIGGEGGIPSYKIILPDGGTVFIRGKVDRVDSMHCTDESGKESNYIRVIDYKTGNKKFNLDDIMCGINVQMLLYLSAISSNGTELLGDNIVPCAVLYVPSSVPSVNKDSYATDDKIESERDKALSMNGIAIDNENILNAMNGEGGAFIKYQKQKSNSIPPVTLCSREELGLIFKKIDNIIMNMADNLHRGKIAATPLSVTRKGSDSSKPDGCAYCPYDSICAFEEGMATNTHIKFDKAEDVLKAIKDDEKEESERKDDTNG